MCIKWNDKLQTSGVAAVVDAVVVVVTVHADQFVASPPPPFRKVVALFPVSGYNSNNSCKTAKTLKVSSPLKISTHRFPSVDQAHSWLFRNGN